MYKKILQNIYDDLHLQQQSIMEELKLFPAKKLHISKRNHGLTFYVNENNRRTSIGKNPKLIKLLIKKTFLEEQLKILQKDTRLIGNACEYFEELSAASARMAQNH